MNERKAAAITRMVNALEELSRIEHDAGDVGEGWELRGQADAWYALQQPEEDRDAWYRTAREQAHGFYRNRWLKGWAKVDM